MSDETNKTIASTLNTKIRTSWVWMVLAITVGLTVLFYFSQKPQVVEYSRYVKSLSDYLLQESQVSRSLDRIRVGLDADTVAFQNQTSALREMAVAFSREMDGIRNKGDRAPTFESVNRFERETLGKVASMRRYAARRAVWFQSFQKSRELLFDQSPSVQGKMLNLLDSARAGHLVVLSSSGDEEIAMLPDSVRNAITQLFQENEEMYMAWTAFNNNMSMAYAEDLTRFFQMESLNEVALKEKIPMAFYFLSLVLLLSTFFFVLYARR